jgi:hypothetical protein
MFCGCELFQKNIKVIDSMIEFGFIHGIRYTADFFVYCPWCGKKLESHFCKAILEELASMGDIEKEGEK